MSIGFYVRVASYLGDRIAAERELSEINRVLRQAGLPARTGASVPAAIALGDHRGPGIRAEPDP